MPQGHMALEVVAPASETFSLTTRERAFESNWMGGWVGPGAGLNASEKKSIFCPYQESNHNSQLIPQSLYYVIPAPPFPNNSWHICIIR
jgi:hypothetical protein